MTRSQIPVTIVTGFLGSGKTTLLAGLIRRRQSRRLALLINEFGEVSVDGAVLRLSADQNNEQINKQVNKQVNEQIRITELSHGLIAYSDDTQFMPAMQAIAARRATVDHVLIETSGLALPSAVMALLQEPQLAADFILDATLAVVDTPLLLAGQFALPEAVATLFERQLALADVVVLNKIDTLDEAALLHAETLVRQCAPNVRFLELAFQAQLDIRVALGLRLHQVAAAASAHGTHGLNGSHGAPDVAAPGARFTYMPAADAQLLPDQNFLNGHAHSGIGAHSHGLTTHRHFHEQDPGWLSFTLRSDAAQPLPLLQQALVAAACQEPVLRSKGYVRAADRCAPVLVQGVRARISVTEAQTGATGTDAADAAGVPAAQRSELVFIGYHLSRARVARLLSTMTATDWR